MVGSDYSTKERGAKKGDDFAWKYSKQIPGEKYFRCKFCHSAKITHGGITPCPKVPESVALECKNVLDAVQPEKKTTNNPPSPSPSPNSRKRKKEEPRKKKEEDKIKESRLYGRFYFSKKSRDVKKRPKIECHNEVTTQQEVEVGNQAVEFIIRKGSPPNLHVNSLPTSLAAAAADAVGKDCTCDEVELPTHCTGSQDASGGNIAGVSETDCRSENAIIMAITKISYDVVCDQQPLQMCSGGIELDDSRIYSGGTMNQRNEARESQVGLPRIDCTDNKVPRLNSELPFVKSLLWERIVSMEVFQAMQQNPHFHPLYDSMEAKRVGLAIGYMVTFANLVETTCKLQLDDPRSILASHLEVLLDLEMHGFDVHVLRNRFNELLAIKDEQEQNLDKFKKSESELSEDVNKRSKIDEEIDEFNKKIREFKEKQELARSIQKILDAEIATLELSVDDICEGMRNTQLDFGRVSVAP